MKNLSFVFNGFKSARVGALTLIFAFLAFASESSQASGVNLQFYTSPSLSVSPTGVWGSTISVPMSVSNISTTASGAFQVYLYLEKTDGTNPVLFQTVSFPSLVYPSAYYAVGTVTATLPKYIPTGLSSGTLRVQATIMLNGVAGQTASAGNIIVTAPSPDLVGYNSGSYGFGVQQSSATWGQTLGVKYAIINQTAGTAGPFTANVYLCEANNFGASNVPGSHTYLLGSVSCSGLQGGYITYSATTGGTAGYNNFTLPSANPFGDGATSFYIGMVINPTTNNPLTPLTESVYTNDCNQGAGIDSGASAVTITVPQPSLLASESSSSGTNTLTFGNVAVDGTGGAVGTQTVTLTDSGPAVLNITGMSISGAPFQITNVVSSIQNLTQPLAYPRPIQANGAENWVVTVTYDPTVIGTQSGSLVVSSNDPNHPTTTISLSGTGIAVPKLSFLDPVPPANDLNADYGGIVNDGAGGASSSQTFTLSNTGSGPLTISQNGIGLTDTASGVWSITSITSSTQGAINLSSATKTIAANGAETWSVMVKFDPIASANYVTGLQVASNDPTLPLATCTLKGAGLAPMTLNVTDSIGSPTDHAMNFGSAYATGRAQATGTVTLTNTGQAPLVLAQNGIALASGTHFKITNIQSSTQGVINLANGTATLAPNQAETWTVSVAFAPTAAGALGTQLNILSNDPTHGTVPVALSGVGLDQPGIQVTDSSGDANDHSIAFGPVLNDGAGNRVATQTMTVQNVGSQPLVVPQNGILAANSPGYSIQGIVSSTQGTINLATGSATLAANQAEIWTVTMAFDPVANIAYTGTASIQSNDPLTPTVSVALSGSGTQPTITMLPQTASPTLYLPAGQIYTFNWNASYTGGSAQINLYRDTDTDPSAGLVQIAANLPYTSGVTNISTYSWQPDASLAGQEFYLYGTIQNGTVSNGSYAAQKVHIEPAGAFTLLSPLETTSTTYTYEYLYNGKVYAGTVQLQPGQNVITITTPLSGGGNAIHQITVNQAASLLATQGYTYDELNRIKTYTNGNGIVTTYTYDFSGNLTKTSASNGNTVNYTYDLLNRRTSMTDSTGTTFYDYDDLDRVTAITYSTDAVKGNADDLVLAYAYDNANRVTLMTYPGGEQIAYTYDNAGRMLTANDVTTTQNTSYVYSPTSGLLQTTTRANGVVTTYGYDNMGRVNDIKHALGAKTLAEYAYILDSFGNATSLLTTFADGSQKQEKYTYDSLNRLTQVIYGSGAVANANDKTVAYTYDGVGNRLTQTTTINGVATQTLTYVYGSENQLLLVSDQNGALIASYVYDPAGNRVQRTTPSGDTFYKYDERNLLTSILTPTEYTIYTYNGSAQRVSKNSNGASSLYIVDSGQNSFRNIQERSGGKIQKNHIYGVDRLESNVSSNLALVYMDDRLGSVRMTTDSVGNIVSNNDYDAFGNTSTLVQEFGFTGEEQESSYLYLRARNYDPVVGMFLTKDPLGIDGGLNTYVYTKQNPVNSVDHSGLDTNSIDFGGFVGIGDGVGGDGIAQISVVWDGTSMLPKVQASGGAAAGPNFGGDANINLGYTHTTAPTADDLLGGAQVAGGTVQDVFGGGANLITSLPGSSTPYLGVHVDAAFGEGADFYYGRTYTIDITPTQEGMAAAARADINGITSGVGYVENQIFSLGVSVIKSALPSGESSATEPGSISDFGDPSISLPNFAQTQLDVGGVLIDKAATLIGTNLSSITGATFDPVTKQIVFLGSSNVVASTAINMDYFYTAVQAVYGSATPPFVTLDPPASMATPWTDYGNADGVLENGETNGFILRYNPLWSGEDTTVDVRVRATWNGTNYDFTLHFNCVALNGPPITISAGGRYAMALVYTGATNLPAGMTLNTSPFLAGKVPNSLQLTSTSQDSYWPVYLTNNTGGSMIITSVSVIPARQHREYGGRVDGTRLGWVMYEADRVMKCLGIGKDDLTGATYSSATVNVPGYMSLLERAEAGTSTGGNVRMWFEPNDMTLQRYVDSTTGQATIAFQTSTVTLLTESYLQGLPQDPSAAAFAAHFGQNYDSFAALNFPVEDPTDATGKTIINVPIFALLKQAMQAVSLARFFHDNNIPLDMWWLNSWQPPTAYSPKSIATAYNEVTNGSAWYLLYGGVQVQKPNSYVPSTTAQAIGQAVAAARPGDPANPTDDLPTQAWSAGTSSGTMNAVAASLSHDYQDGNVNLAHRDFSFASPGELQLSFTRYYQSSWVGTGNLGPGWRDIRYVLQFSNPSWYDQNHLMTDSAGRTITTDSNLDTRLRSGTIRLVDLSTGAMLDFQSSLGLGYGINSLGNPVVSISGLTSSDVPTFTPGQHQNGTTLGQTTDGKYSYYATLPDGSVVNFDSNGNLLMTTDRHGYSQSYTYDGSNRLASITDSAKQVITLAYNANSTLLSASGPNGVGVTYGYDSSGRLASVTDKLSTVVIAQYTYNGENQIVDVTLMDGTKPVTTTADTKGRSSVRKDRRGNTSNWSYYKNASTGARVSMAQDPNSGLPAAQKGADSNGRTTYTMDPLGNTTTYGYTGSSLLPSTVQLATPNRPAISIARNTAGQPTTITDPAVPAAQPTQIIYNNANLPTQLTDGAGRATQYTYTGSSNLQRKRRMHNNQPVDTSFGYQSEFLTSVTDPLTHTWNLGRDTLGRLTSVQDPTSVSVSYDYDTMGRLWKIHDPRLSSPVTYAYDTLNRVTSVSTPAGTTTYAYDPVTTWCTSATTTTTDGQTRSVQYSYNNQNGDVTGTTYQLPQAGGGTTSLTTKYTYTPLGNLQSVTPPGAAAINYNYNGVGQLLGTSETSVGLKLAPPGLTANNATSDVWTNQANQTFVWEAPPSSLPVTGYNFAEDAATMLSVNSTSPTVAWNNVPDGKHTFRVRGVDSADNWSPEANFDLWVDTTPPTIAAPTLSSVSQGNSVTVATSVSDALSGLGNNIPQLSWCASSDATRNWGVAANMAAGSGSQWSGSVSANWPQYTGKTLYLQVQGQDVAGNVTNQITPAGIVTVVGNPSTGGTPTGGGIFANGASAAVGTGTNPGFAFANWTVAGNPVSTSPSYSFGVNGIQTLVANYVPTSFTTWKSIYFNVAQLADPTISGDSAAPSGDGVANLLKYALGMNPNVASQSGLPTVTMMKLNNALYLSMIYTRNKAATDISFHPEWSGDLVNWSNSGMNENILLDGATTQQVQDLVPANSATRMFMHLRVTRP